MIRLNEIDHKMPIKVTKVNAALQNMMNSDKDVAVKDLISSSIRWSGLSIPSYDRTL